MPKKNKWAHLRIKSMLDNEELTTTEIKERLSNAKNANGRPVKKGHVSPNQLQMILRIHYEKAGFCKIHNNIIWRNKQ